MRKIEERMCHAVINGKNMSKDNTTVEVTYTPNGEYHHAFVRLFGNEIAHYYWSGEERSWVLRLSDGLRRTVTTKSRLNALLEGVAKGDRLRIYSKGWDNEQHTQQIWFYQMGANHYRWENGSATFQATNPIESHAVGPK